VAGARVEVLGGDHAMIYPDIPVISNNAYLVDGTHLHPGDSFTPPSTQVEVLFVPTSAPWLKIAEAIDYLRAVAPRTAVPIHQAVLSAPGQQLHYRLLENFSSQDTTVQVLEPGNATTL
jgi:L-ascorbate metabolism protein UlaG (beta-lactamase superfamily)